MMKDLKRENRNYRESLLKNLIFSLILVSSFFIILELFLRISGLVEVKFLKFPDYETYNKIVGIFSPDQDFIEIVTFKSKLPYHVHINSQGLRGKEFHLKKASNTFRILCLGDSFTFSRFVDEGETYPTKLEEFLNRNSTGKKFEVINGGASAYTIVDELSYLKEKGIKVQPDLVILGFVMNDIAELTRKKDFRENQKEEREYWASSPFGPLRQKLLDTVIYNLFRSLISYVKYKTETDVTIPEVSYNIVFKEDYDKNILKLWDKYEKNLRDMRDYLAARKIKLIMVIFPVDEQVNNGFSNKPQMFLKNMCGRLGIEVSDFLPEFKEGAKKGNHLFFTPYDGHPTKYGDRVAAWVTYNFLKNKGLVSVK